MKMKRITAALLCLILVLSTAMAFSETNNALSNSTASVKGNSNFKTLSLKRGKTIRAFAWGDFDDCKYVYYWAPQNKWQDSYGQLLNPIKCPDAVGTVRVKIASNCSWLIAKVNKNNRIELSVKGCNKTLKYKTGVVEVYDKKGIYGKIRVLRSGTAKFSSIKQSGKKIVLGLEQHEQINYYDGSYIHVDVYDEKGTFVSSDFPTNHERISSSSAKKYIDTSTELKKGYQYVYRIGFGSPAFNSGYQKGAAYIKIDKVNGKATGSVYFSSNREELNAWIDKKIKH